MRVKVEVEAIKFRPVSEQRKFVAKALKAFNPVFRHKVQQRFDEGGPGWAPRKERGGAETTRAEKIKGLAEHRLRRKLERELRRAQTRLARGRGKAAAVQRRAAVLREFERQAAGGGVGVGKRLRAGSKEQAIAFLSGTNLGSRSLQKSVAGLRDRMQRAQAHYEGKTLGRIAGSISSKAARAELEVYSRIPWAGIHNDGGRAGRGATEPPRPFLFVEPEDVDLLAEMVEVAAVNAL